jgi:endonuclease YncB( thermonuclease family)
MPFTLIKGTFHVVGLEPDGDSMKFVPADRRNLGKIQGKAKVDAKGRVQLRFEAIDAPETHYKNVSQPRARASADAMLRFAGFIDVRWGDRKVTSVARDGISGYILTRATDGKYGRPVAFVFAGTSGRADGSSQHLDTTWLRDSLNYRLAAEGLAYPMYYTSLFYDLRDEFTAAIARARRARRGIWPHDRSRQFSVAGLRKADLSAITERALIYPKLFRRLTEHVLAEGSVAGFGAFLAGQAEGVEVLSRNQHTHFDTVVKVRGATVELAAAPEDLVFTP